MAQLVLSGSTRVFAVVGDPIAQVRSPSVITSLMAERREDAIVVPMHVVGRDLGPLMGSLYAVRNVGGALVTIPHKQATLPLCSSVTSRAAFVGAVNVVKRTPDGWHGDNTDGLGYLDGIEKEGFMALGRTALLIGCGGAGSAIALEILKRGASKLAIHDIDTARRDEVIAHLSKSFPGRVTVGSRDPKGFDLVANATPLGMRSDEVLPVDISALQAWQFVACVVTKPDVPRLIREARGIGCKTMTGAGMFDAQADTLVDFLLSEESGERAA